MSLINQEEKRRRYNADNAVFAINLIFIKNKVSQ